MIKTIMVCDQCGKEHKGHTADGWLDVKPAGRYANTFTNAFMFPDIYGLYCSVECLSEKIAEKTQEVKDLAEKGVYKWQGFEYKLTR